MFWTRKKTVSDVVVPSPYNIQGDNNHIWIVENGNRRELLKNEKIDGLLISIKGNNNTITLHKPFTFINSAVFFDSHDSFVTIEADSICNTLKILNNGGFKNRNVSIGKNFRCWGCEILLNGRNNSVLIGNDCVFSKEIHIMNGDGHPILIDDKPLPLLRDVVIGHHVWIGMGVYILKNVKISDNCIIGAASVVAKSILEQNVAAAGNPCKIIKRNISWKT